MLQLAALLTQIYCGDKSAGNPLNDRYTCVQAQWAQSIKYRHQPLHYPLPDSQPLLMLYMYHVANLINM